MTVGMRQRQSRGGVRRGERRSCVAVFNFGHGHVQGVKVSSRSVHVERGMLEWCGCCRTPLCPCPCTAAWSIAVVLGLEEKGMVLGGWTWPLDDQACPGYKERERG